jgi:hypothetical protein
MSPEPDADFHAPLANTHCAAFNTWSRTFTIDATNFLTEKSLAFASFWRDGTSRLASDVIPTPSELVFFHRYAPMAVDVARLGGKEMLAALRSAGCAMLSKGIAESSTLNSKKQLLERGVMLTSGHQLRIHPKLVNLLGPRLERLVDFCVGLNATLPNPELGISRELFRDSVLERNSSIALTYQLALLIGSMPPELYNHTFSATSLHASGLKPISEVMTATDLLDFSAAQFKGWKIRKQLEAGGEQHESFTELVKTGQVSARDQAFIVQLSLGLVDVFRSLGGYGITLLADKGRAMSEQGIEPDREVHQNLSNGIRDAAGRRIEFNPRLLNQIAFALHANWLYARDWCAKLPDPNLWPKEHPAHVYWNPNLPPDDQTYDPDRLNAMTQSIVLSELRGDSAAQRDPERQALFDKLYTACAGTTERYDFNPELSIEQTRVSEATSFVNLDSVSLFANSFGDNLAHTIERRLHGHRWNSDRSITIEPAKAWDGIRVHQKVFEFFYSAHLEALSRTLGPQEMLLLKALGNSLLNESPLRVARGEVRGEPGIILEFHSGKPFKVEGKSIGRIFGTFEKAWNYAQASALLLAQDTGRPELIRSTNPKTDWLRLEDDLARLRTDGSSAPDRVFERIAAAAYSWAHRIPTSDETAFDNLRSKSFFLVGSPGLQVADSALQRMGHTHARLFGDTVFSNFEALKIMILNDPRCVDLSSEHFLTSSATKFVANHSLALLGLLGTTELEKLREAGANFLKVDPTNRVYWTRLMVDRRWLEVHQTNSTRPVLNTSIRIPLFNKCFQVSEFGNDLVKYIEAAPESLASNSTAAGTNLTPLWLKSFSTPFSSEREPHDTIQTSAIAVAIAQSLAELAEQDFNKLLAGSYDSGWI